MPPINDLSPDPGVTLSFLNDAFGHIVERGLIEIAHSGPDGGAINRARLFENTPEGRFEAAEHAAKVNASTGQNVYFAPSLRKPDADRGKRARKGDVLGAAMLWADFDAPGSQAAGRLAYNAVSVAPHLAVVTGTKPDMRAQAFWLLDDLVTDQDRLDEMLAGVHVGLGFVADPKVVNADRIMRLPGCIAWPKPGKEGRVPEVTGLHRPKAAPASRYAPSAIEGVFPRRDPVAARKGEDVAPRGDLLAHTSPAPSTTVAPAPALVVQEREFDMLGRRIDGRDEYAMQIIGGAIRNLTAKLGRWPNAEEIAREAWPTFERGVAPKNPSSTLEAEGRGWTWFAEKCSTHARRAAGGQIAGMETVEKAIAGAAAQGRVQVFGQPDPAAVQTAVSERATGLLARMVRGSDIKADLNRRYVVKRWLYADTLGVTYGAPGSSKSFFVLDLLRHVVSGEEWRGNRVRRAPVLYIAGEGAAGIFNRVVAAGGVGEGFVFLPSLVDLCSNEVDARAIVEAFRALAPEAGMPGVIVIDTLARAMGGGDENASQDMGRLIRHADLLRELTGAHVHLVHHSGKDTGKGARGHSSLLGALDTEIHVEELDDGVRIATITKQKDGEEGLTAAYTLARVDLGTDLDGEIVSSCIVEPCDVPEKGASAKLTQEQRRVLDALREFITDHGVPNPGGAGWPEIGVRKTVDLATFKAFAAAREPDADEPAKANRRVRDMPKKLHGHGITCTNEGRIWIVPKGDDATT